MIKLKSVFSTPTSLELAQRELDEARRALLEAQSARDYACAMVVYHNSRISRLEDVLNKNPLG